MATVECSSVADFQRKLARDMKRLRKQLDAAIVKTSHDAIPIIRKNTPKAFGHLRDSIHAGSMADVIQTIVSAPHASAVEVGSRPHLVPLGELEKWVRLRGMQALNPKFRKSPEKHGTSTAMQSRSVGRQLRAMRVGGATPVDAPLQIAKAIQAAILKAGTMPHWMVRMSLPAIESKLADNMSKVLK